MTLPGGKWSTEPDIMPVEVTGEPLLFKGENFARTGIEAAWPDR